MDAGPARRRAAGFSLSELLLTLVALGLVVWLALRIVDRGTRIPADAPAGSGPDAVLDAAIRSIAKDVRAATAGGLPVREAVRPVADNTRPPSPSSYRTAAGGSVTVRPGTDQLGLKGVIRSPLLALDPRPSGASDSMSDRIRSRPTDVPVHAPSADPVGAVRARLAETAAKTFFLVRDAAGRWAVGRVVSVAAGAPDGPLDLIADFADADARARNAGPDAAAALGDPVSGGVLDDLVWFVADGASGYPPDFVAASDPESLRHPHPYLAVASATGDGRWDVRGAGEDIEDFQVAWGLSGPAGALEWHGDAPGSGAPTVDALVDVGGRSRLRALRLALVARSPLRLPRSSGSPAPEFAVPLNGPAAGTLPGAAPIGWDPYPQRRIRFDREVRDEVVTLPAPAS